MGLLLNDDFKTSAIAGGDDRLLTDEQIYVEANSINKTLKQAINDGNIGSGAQKVETINSGTEYTITSAQNESIFRHQSLKSVNYYLPTPEAGLRHHFVHDGYQSNAAQLSRYLAATDFPNTTNLYGWRGGASGFTTVNGGIALTENGTLAAQTDYQGNTTDCGFDGNGYLSSSDAALQSNGTQSIGIWASRSSWTNSGSQQMLLSQFSSSGWILYIVGSSATLMLQTSSGAEVSADLSNLSPGDHFFSVVRDSTISKVFLCVDGVKVAHASYSAFSISGNFEVGSYNGGSSKFNGKIMEVWYHVGTAWTEEQVRCLYELGPYGRTMNRAKIYPSSGTKIVAAGGVVVNPGFLALNRKGVKVSLVALDATTWEIESATAIGHLKNTTIGMTRNIGLIGKDTWLTKQALPTASYASGGFDLNGYGYYVCGFISSSGTATVNKYNPDQNSWQAAASLYACYSPFAFSFNGYGFAGTGVSVSTFFYSASRYSDTADAWTGVIASPIWAADPGSSALNGYGYYVGGYDNGGVLTSTLRYNSGLDNWSYMATVPSSSGRPVSVTSNGYIYNTPCSNAAWYQFNDSFNAWVTKASFIAGVGEKNGFALNGKVYINGGADGANYEYDDSVGAWAVKNISPAAQAATGHSLFGFGYIWGGYTMNTNNAQYN